MVSVEVALHQAACNIVVAGDGVSALCVCVCVCQDSTRVFETCVCVCVCVQMLLVLVPLHVQGEVVGTGKGARADGALEGFGARVLPVMARQLVRTSETPVAAVPRAPVRLLTCEAGQKERSLNECSRPLRNGANSRSEMNFLLNHMISSTVFQSRDALICD